MVIRISDKKKNYGKVTKLLVKPKKIILHLDNDDTGKRATQSIISILDETYKCVDEHPTYFKDINEKLVFAKMDQQRKEKC